MKILIADANSDWAMNSKAFFENNNLSVHLCQNGKEAQLEIFKHNYDCLVLDMDIQNYSGLMVLKYMRLTHPSIRIVLTINSKLRLNEIGLSVDELKKTGATTVLVKPFTNDTLMKNIKGERFDSWKEIKPNTDEFSDEKILQEKDEDFTRMKLEECGIGNMAIFDHYIRIGQGRFIKIFRKGDLFDRNRLNKYKAEKKIEFLYFKTKDRTTYINFMNEMLHKVSERNQKVSPQVMTHLHSLSDMFIDEVYTAGIKPALVEEGMKICQTMYKTIKSDTELSKHVRDMQIEGSCNKSHLFLVSFFATIICKNLEWSSERTTETVAMAGLLHDIGKLKLPPALRNMEEHLVPKDQIEIFRQHPLHGMEMLSKNKLIGEPVKQIIYQHHELINGTGYPNALTGAKIYPLAKVVCLADGFINFLVEKNLSPLEGLKQFIPDKVETSKYDAMAIKSLVKGLIK